MPLFFVTAEGGIPVKDKPGPGGTGETIGHLDHLAYFEGSAVSKGYIQVVAAKVRPHPPIVASLTGLWPAPGTAGWVS